MTNRITQKRLETLVANLNRETGNPTTPYTRDDSGNLRANVGAYVTDYAYGGVKLAQMMNEAGGQRDVLHSGYVTKRELYDLIHAYMAGIWDLKHRK